MLTATIVLNNGGINLPSDSVRWWWRWVLWANPLWWSQQALAINEFRCVLPNRQQQRCKVATSVCACKMMQFARRSCVGTLRHLVSHMLRSAAAGLPAGRCPAPFRASASATCCLEQRSFHSSKVWIWTAFAYIAGAIVITNLAIIGCLAWLRGLVLLLLSAASSCTLSSFTCMRC